MLSKYKVIFFDLGDTLITTTKNWLPGALELILELRGHNLRLGVISNTAQLNREQLQELLPVDFTWDHFEENLIILSSEVNIEKPSIEIFKLAISKSGIASHLCLFCTENSLDCLVAQQAGMHSYRVQKPPVNDTADVMLTLKKLDNI